MVIQKIKVEPEQIKDSTYGVPEAGRGGRENQLEMAVLDICNIIH